MWRLRWQRPTGEKMKSLRARPCPRCGGPNKRKSKNNGYCLKCNNEKMAEWKKTHPLNDEERRKHNVRSYTRVYEKRGKLKRKPCFFCGKKAERHHEDYSKPLEIDYWCPHHHRLYHRKRKEGKTRDKSIREIKKEHARSHL